LEDSMYVIYKFIGSSRYFLAAGRMWVRDRNLARKFQTRWDAEQTAKLLFADITFA